MLAAAVLSVGSYSLVLAESKDNGDGLSLVASTTLNVGVKAESGDDNTSVSAEAKSESEVSDEGSSSNKERDSEEKDSMSSSTATSSKEREEHSEGDEHRSDVAIFVQNLLRIADRDGGIGKEVREIARGEATSSASTTEAIVKVEARNKFVTLLIGSDFKSLGVIRSSLARTDKAIERLSALASSTTNASVKADLTAQINALQAEQVKVKAFVDANESAFSLLGWFVKIFVK